MRDLLKSKLILLFTVMVFLVVSVSAQQPPQSHPLSEITPIDTDLEMSDQRIENVSALQLNNGPNTKGLKLDGFTVSDQGEAAKFTLDFSDDQWEIRDSNLSLEGNSIRNFFDNSCPNGQALVTINDDGSFECTSISGDVASDYVNITGDTMEGDLNLNSYSIVDPAEVDGVNISNPGNAIQISGNQYIIPSNAISTDEIANSAVTSSEISDGTILNEDLSSDSVTFSSGDHLTGGGTVPLGGSATFNVDGSTLTWSELGISQWEVNVSNLGAADSDLDMNGFSLNNYYSSGCQSGYVMVDVENSGSIQCVNVTNEVQDAYVNREGDSMTGGLEMNSNRITGLKDPDSSQDAATKSFVETYADTNDANGTDDQVLSTTDDITGTNDQITIENGNSITIDDDFAADDQALGTSGNQITLDNGGSITVPYATNSDQLDGVQLANINWGDVAMAQSDVGPADVGLADLSTGSSISGSTYDGTTAYTWNVNWQDANDLGSGGTISDFSAANDLNSGGGISDFSNANDLDGNGNIADFSAANGLNSNGQVVDTECSGNDYLAGDGTCNVDSTEDYHDLADVLNDNNGANQDINMNGYNLDAVGKLADVDSTAHVNNLNADLLDGNEPTNLKVHNIENTGRITEHDGGSSVFLEDGLKVGEVYNNGYPASYGNLMQVGGEGDAEILFQWEGGSAETGKIYYRSKRDTSDTAWGDWRYLWHSGDNLDLNDQDITNVNQLGDVDSTSQVNNLNADYLDGHNIGEICEADGTDCPTDNTEDYHDLADVLNDNNVASQNIDMNGNDVTSSGGEMCVGQYC